MLYVLHGNDFKKKRRKLAEMLAALEKKRPNATVLSFSEENFMEFPPAEKISELLSSQALFGGSYVAVLDSLFELAAKELVGSAKEMVESEHVFVIVEEDLKASDIKAFEKSGAKVEEFKKRQTIEKKFNVFSLADALASKNKKSLWALYQQALREELEPESIAGTLFWQTKTLILVSKGDTKGIKPFSVSKAKKNLSKWSEEELRTTSSDLISAYHNARKGGLPLSEALELFLLKI